MCPKYEDKDAHEWHHDREHSHEPNESRIYVIRSGMALTVMTIILMIVSIPIMIRSNLDLSDWKKEVALTGVVMVMTGTVSTVLVMWQPL